MVFEKDTSQAFISSGEKQMQLFFLFSDTVKCFRGKREREAGLWISNMTPMYPSNIMLPWGSGLVKERKEGAPNSVCWLRAASFFLKSVPKNRKCSGFMCLWVRDALFEDRFGKHRALESKQRVSLFVSGWFSKALVDHCEELHYVLLASQEC